MPFCILDYSAISFTQFFHSNSILAQLCLKKKKTVDLGHSSSNGEIIKPKLFHGQGHYILDDTKITCKLGWFHSIAQ